MASSGSFNTSTYSGTSFEFSWTASQNISNNTSTINWKVTCIKNSSGYYYCHWTIVVDGATRSSVDQGSRVQVKNGQVIASGSVTVTHNDAGKRSFSASVSAAPYAYAMNCTGSGSWSLNDIPRKPTVTQTISDIQETEFTLNWNTDKACNRVWYSIDGGTTWSNAIDLSPAATSGTIRIVNNGTSTPTAITRNTQYSVQFCAHNKDVSLDTSAGDGYSEKITITTYNIPYILTAPDFNISDDGALVELYNPLNRVVSINTTYTDINGQSVILYTSPQGFNATSFNISLDPNIRSNLYSSIPSSIQGNYVTNITYNNESSTKTGYYKATSVGVSFGDISYVDGMNYSFVNNSVFVQNKSLFVPTISNITAFNGTILNEGSASVNIAGTTYNLTYDNSTYTHPGITINSRSNITAVFTISDSRGLSIVENRNITVLPYDNPTITYEVGRVQNFYPMVDITPHAIVTDLGQHSVGTGNVPTITLLAEAIPSGAATSVNDSLTNNQLNQWYDLSHQLNNEYGWNLTFTVTDSFGTITTSTTTLSRGIPLIFIDTDKNSVGIEQFPTHNSSLEVHGSIYLNDEEIGNGDVTAEIVGQVTGQIPTLFDLVYPVGSIYMSVNSTSPSTLFGGTWLQISDTFLLAAGSTYTAGDTGGEATHTLTTAEMPSHTHALTNGYGYDSWYQVRDSASGDNVGVSTYPYSNTPLSVLNTGGDGAHNNMPPYLVVYVWKRTA